MSNQSRAGSLKHVSITQRLPSDDTLTHGAPHAQLADPHARRLEPELPHSRLRPAVLSTILTEWRNNA